MIGAKMQQKRNMSWQKLKGNDSFRLSVVISAMVLLLFATNTVAYLQALIKIDHSIITNACKIILLLLMIVNIKPILRRMTVEKIGGLMLIALLFCISCFVTTDRPLLRSIFLRFCLTVLPIIVVIGCIDDYNVLLSMLIWISRIIAVCAVALLIPKGYNRTTYFMGLANALTLPVVMLLYSAYMSGKVIDLILAGLDTVVIAIIGSRGALLGIIVFFMILLIAGLKRKDRRVICLVIIAIGLLALLFWRPLLTMLVAALKRIGWASRTLNYMLDGDLHISTRIAIYTPLKKELLAHPFIIHGIGGERQFAADGYAHNFILELLINFGAVLGGAAVLYILYQSGRTVVTGIRQEDPFHMAALIFFCISLPIAFVSGTIWDSVYLWCWLVLCDKRYPAPAGVSAKGTKEGKLLSIVIPTKNRYTYLYSFIDLCATFPNKDFELVIQDNSDDNRPILEFLEKGGYDFVSYQYDPSPLSVIENSELAVKNACGRYVCFMGDDDLLSGKLVDFVGYMEQQGIDSAVFRTAQYDWPGVTHKAHRFPNLTIRSFDGQMKQVNVKQAYRRLLRVGAVGMEHMPQLYHGVVRRTALDQVYAACGTYFPGPSPDMAICAALAPFVRKHVYFNVPLISSGASPKSAAGLGAKHMHKGELKAVSFLPKDIEERWDERLPRVWTGPTVYAQSAFEALKAVGREADIRWFGFAYFFAFLDTFYQDYRELSKAYRRKNKVNELLYLLDRLSIFILRASKFVSNKLLLTIQMGGTLIDDVPNSAEAQKHIDAMIQHVPLPF